MAQADNLESLRDSIVPVAHSSDATDIEQSSWAIDVNLLERLLLFETAGQRDHETDPSLQSDTLTPKTTKKHGKSHTSTTYDLIGSVGISGHQSVPKDTPISAPPVGERSGHCNGPDIDFFASMTPGMSGFEGYLDYQGITGPNGLEGCSSMFLPANEYGRSIDDWLGIDLL